MYEKLLTMRPPEWDRVQVWGDLPGFYSRFLLYCLILFIYFDHVYQLLCQFIHIFARVYINIICIYIHTYKMCACAYT